MRRRDALTAATALATLACGVGCRRSSKIRVGSKSFSESVLLGEILAQQLERHGLAVDRRPNLGGTFVCHQAIVAGDLDVYVEYTGTAFAAILGDARKIGDASLVRAEVEKAWPERFGATWLPPLGFDDTFAILVRKADAAKLGLAKVSDLAPHAPKLRPGFGYEFVERKDGFAAWKEAYGLSFAAAPMTMELGLTYRALAEGKVDLIAGNSTDGQIAKLDLVHLVDDRRFFLPYEAAPVVRSEVVSRTPKVEEALRALEGRIDVDRMRAMNRALDVDGKPAAEIARGFLESLPA